MIQPSQATTTQTDRPQAGKEITMTINFKNSITPGKITADKYLLNFISILASEAADKFEREGAGSLAEDARDLSNQIYEALSNAGLYD